MTDASLTLDRLEPGEMATIVALRHEPAQQGRLLEMGLLVGTPVEMIRRAPMGDPIEYRVGDYNLSLRVAVAKLIEVSR